jgi:hypothetical protein
LFASATERGKRIRENDMAPAGSIQAIATTE